IQQVGENLRVALEAAGATLENLVKTTTFVTDIDEFFRHVDVRHDYLGVGLPASTTVEVRRLSHPDLMVEIEAIAVKDRPLSTETTVIVSKPNDSVRCRSSERRPSAGPTNLSIEFRLRKSRCSRSLPQAHEYDGYRSRHHPSFRDRRGHPWLCPGP